MFPWSSIQTEITQKQNHKKSHSTVTVSETKNLILTNLKQIVFLTYVSFYTTIDWSYPCVNERSEHVNLFMHDFLYNIQRPGKLYDLIKQDWQGHFPRAEASVLALTNNGRWTISPMDTATVYAYRRCILREYGYKEVTFQEALFLKQVFISLRPSE